MFNQSARVFVLACLLALSGFSALIYQTLWLRSLGLVFGVTVYAASTVLAAFMAGLALGSFLAGPIADRVREPVRWFGAAELLIAASALSTPWLLGALEDVYRPIYAAVDGQFAVVTVVRFVCSFAILLVPTTLMGATMPLVLRSSTVRASDIGGRAAVLYAANTAGALCGTLATGYYFVSQIGVASTFRVAALCNLAVGFSALLWPLSARAATDHPVAAAAGAGAIATPERTRRAVLVAFAVSGFASLALEIIWFRALVMFVPATIYAFTMILAVVLAGIAVGSAIATFWLRRARNWIWRLALVEIGVALAAVGSLVVLAAAYEAGAADSPLRTTALAVLPATLLMGVAFPIGLQCWSAGRDADRQTGDRVGRFYLVNLSGGILGALAAGFLLIPLAGTRGSLILVSACSLAAGFALLATEFRSRPVLTGGVGTASLALFVAAAILAPDPLHIALPRRYRGETLLWRDEGAQTTVSVQDQGGRRVMYVSGLHQADDTPEVRSVHSLIGTLAMALHSNPRDALVIGLGGGATAGAVAQFQRASVDIVELSQSVIKGSDWFRDLNGDVLRRPNVKLRIDDGRNFLLMTPKRYDVITADTIQPYNAGAGSLYSVEYFQLAAHALRDDGVLLQWVGQQRATQYKIIARTFLEVFPHTTVWGGGTFLLGTKRPLRLPIAAYRERLQDPEFGHALAVAGIAGFGGLMQLYTAGPDELRRFVGAGPLLTDDRPLVEYFRSLPGDEPGDDFRTLSGDYNRHLVPE